MADKKTSEKTTYSRLHRSETNRYIAGVAGGLGEYFGIDPTIIRIIFILLTVFSGSGIIIYLVLWLILPKGDSPTKSNDHVKDNIEEMKEKARRFAHDLKFNSGDNNHALWGVLIIVLGVLFLLDNFGIYSFANFGRLWPVILIIIGLAIISKQ